jgi:hypothetical protein
MPNQASTAANDKIVETDIPARMDRLPWSGLALDDRHRSWDLMASGWLQVTLAGSEKLAISTAITIGLPDSLMSR